MHVPTRDFGKSRSRVHLDPETEMLGVEVNCGIYVVHDVTEARGHGSSFPSSGPTDVERIRITTRRQRLTTCWDRTRLPNCHAAAAFGSPFSTRKLTK